MSPHCLAGLGNFEVVARREGKLTLKENQLLYCCGGGQLFLWSKAASAGSGLYFADWLKH